LYPPLPVVGGAALGEALRLLINAAALLGDVPVGTLRSPQADAESVAVGPVVFGAASP
jgi:hypothetical protein